VQPRPVAQAQSWVPAGREKGRRARTQEGQSSPTSRESAKRVRNSAASRRTTTGPSASTRHRASGQEARCHPRTFEGERVQPSRPLPVVAPRSALELLPSRALTSAWADDPRRHSRTTCKQVFAGLDLLDHRAILRNAPESPEPTAANAQEGRDDPAAARRQGRRALSVGSPHLNCCRVRRDLPSRPSSRCMDSGETAPHRTPATRSRSLRHGTRADPARGLPSGAKRTTAGESVDSPRIGRC
jgi:hypothetical protein